MTGKTSVVVVFLSIFATLSSVLSGIGYMFHTSEDEMISTVTGLIDLIPTSWMVGVIVSIVGSFTAIMLVVWLITVGGACLSYGGFRARRRGARIETEYGIINHNFNGIDIDRIQSVEVSQSFFQRLLNPARFRSRVLRVLPKTLRNHLRRVRRVWSFIRSSSSIRSTRSLQAFAGVARSARTRQEASCACAPSRYHAPRYPAGRRVLAGYHHFHHHVPTGATSELRFPVVFRAQRLSHLLHHGRCLRARALWRGAPDLHRGYRGRDPLA